MAGGGVCASPTTAATPQRRLVTGGSDPADDIALKEASTKEVSTKEACGSSTPAEAKGLQWPAAFCETVRGERLELGESGSLATRSSGVGFGVAFIGPLSLERGTAYFEFEVAEMEPNRSQTLAVGVCCSLPPGPSVRAERARDLGPGSYLLGYDLPKVYANGAEVGKIGTRQWRPLKELSVGSRVGLLVERASMELIVFVDGVRKASANFSAAAGSTQRWGAEVWGVVDAHGTVRAVRLLRPGSRRQLCREDTTLMPPPPGAWPPQPPASPARAQATAAAVAVEAAPAGASPTPKGAARTELTEAASATPAGLATPAAAATPTTVRRGASPPPPGAVMRLASTQDLGGEVPAAGHFSASQAAAASLRRPPAAAGLEVLAGPKKRVRMTCHPCGCMVHLIRHTGDVVHVPRKGDFVIGRNPKSCNLALDSPSVPNMVSRRHAVVVSSDDAVTVVDCESLNGTYVNERRVGRETLRQGDILVIGNPAQSPPDLRFCISMPPALA